MPPSYRVILDTDIGSDVDDAMALSQIFGLPSIDLVGITTVYGDTVLRARLAARIARVAGRTERIHAGEERTLSGREVWWAGHEGVLHDNLPDEAIDSRDAVSFLIDEVVSHPGEIDIIAIGPLTNIATAIEREPRFAASVRHLWIMGGDFSAPEPEHNVSSDIAAARMVFAANIPTTVSGVDVTRLVQIEQTQLDRIAQSGPLGALLLAEITQWWEYWNVEWNVPHDPVTVLTLVNPELFEFSESGHIVVADEGGSEFVPGNGQTRVVRTLDGLQVAERIVADIVAAGRRGAAQGGAE